MRRVSAFVALLAMMIADPLADAEAAESAASPAYAILGDDFAQLREDFNRASGSVRLLFVVDPICPGCLRGMDDMNRDLLSLTNDVRLRTFVVHVPVIGAKATDVGPAARLIHNPHVRNYWNASGEFGRTLARATQLRNEKEQVYAWDVWLLYGPDVEWVGVAPPQPQLLMHQLWKLEGTKFPKLDSKIFAREAQGLVAKVHSAKVE